MDTIAIDLTTQEKELFDTLLDSVLWKGRSTVLRVAGGWILNRESNDIDIALDDQSGVEFANGVNEYLTYLHKETRTIAVIQANPDQSKHLETANLKVLGYEIDFVNLRAETYTDTRIPMTRIGTALEDALRRDFTINALFYNINIHQVEDLTGKGLDDLRASIIRTPISPFVTFADDPLRILRAIRFCSRLNYLLDSELMDAARDAAIQAALQSKVSRERVYKECEGMLNTVYSRPYMAFMLQYRLNVLRCVLPLPEIAMQFQLVAAEQYGTLLTDSWTAGQVRNWQHVAVATMHWLNALFALTNGQLDHSNELGIRGLLDLPAVAQTHSSSHASVAESHTSPVDSFVTTMEVDRNRLARPKFGGHSKVLYWAAQLLPFARAKVIEKKREVPFVSIALREALKMETASMKSIQAVMESAMDLQSTVEESTRRFDIETVVAFLRNCREMWRDAFLLACAASLAKHSLGDTQGHERADCVITELLDQHSTADIFQSVKLSVTELAIIRKFQRAQEDLEALQLDNVWNLRPLLDGTQLSQALSLPKGPMIGKVLQEQLLWQIRERSEDRDACIMYLKRKFVDIEPTS